MHRRAFIAGAAFAALVPAHARARPRRGDLGLIGDGAADETAALQTAIDRTPAGGELVLPAGRYRIDGGLIVRSGLRLRGALPGVAVLVQSAEAQAPLIASAWIDPAPQRDLRLSDLVLDGNARDQAWGRQMPLLRLDDVAGLRIAGLTVRNGASSGIALSRCADAEIAACRIADMRRNGVLIQGCRDVRVRDCRFRDLGSRTDALGFDHSGHAVIVTNTGPGESRDVVLIGNRAVDCHDSNFRFGAASADCIARDNLSIRAGKDALKCSERSRNCDFVGNRIVDAGNSAIVLEGSGGGHRALANRIGRVGANDDFPERKRPGARGIYAIGADCEVRDNIVRGTGRGEGIRVLGESHRIAGNRIVKAAGAGIFSYRLRDSLIESNLIRDAAAAGIVLVGRDDSPVRDNIVRGNLIRFSAGGGARHGIVLKGVALANRITGNTIAGAHARAILLADGADANHVAGNSIGEVE